MSKTMAWYKSTYFLAFPVGVLGGFTMSSEMPGEGGMFLGLIVLGIAIRWMFVSQRLGIRDLFLRHRGDAGFNSVKWSIMALGIAGSNAGAAAVWFMSKGNLGVAWGGLLIALVGLAFGIYAYPKAVSRLAQFG